MGEDHRECQAARRGRRDILRALANPLRGFTGQGDHAVTMVVGPARDGLVLEVGVVFDDDPRVIHAMPARRKYWP